jgi:apolipoprotein N-acyltransferase
MIRASARAARGAFRTHRLPVGLAALSGLLMAAGQAPVSLALPAFVGFVGIFAILRHASTSGGAAWIGWAAGLGYFGATLFWIVEPFLIDPVRHGWMAPFALVLLPGGLALFWALAFALATRAGAGWRRLMLAAALLAAAETSRAWLLTGFPWALAGYMWIGAPQMQLAAVIGPHGLTLGTALLAALAALGLRRRPGAWLAAPAAAALVVGAAGSWGAARLSQPLPDSGQPVTVRIVQPNAEQSLKWDPDLALVFYERLLWHTVAAPRDEGPMPDLTVWPETAVQYLLDDEGHLTGAIDAAANGRPVLFGIVREEAGRYYNSLVTTAEGGGAAEIYDKAHLTPFGEYLPLAGLFERFGIFGLAATQGFAAGPGPQVIDSRAAGPVLPLICYEAIFPQNLRGTSRPRWIVQITNDAWFGRISGPYQHLAQARLRAVEQGLPLVRAANTGVSAMIGPRGELEGQIALGVEGHLDAVLPPALPPTPYARSGDLPALIAILLAVLGFALAALRRAH